MSAVPRDVRRAHPLLEDTKFHARLLRLARMYGAGDETQDAVQETMLAIWTRGEHWHEGRIVLELKNQVRRIRRKAKVRAHLNIPLEDAENRDRFHACGRAREKTEW